MVKLTINGKAIEVPEGLTVLEAARSIGIEIPTLCYHEAVKPYGACRLCVVEITSKTPSELASSCTLPVQEGMKIETDSEEVLEARRFIVELLLARSPNVEKIKELALQLGVKKPRFELEEDDCILCGLCARVCREVVGIGAISLVERGFERDVKPPLETPSNACIGCGTCVYVCPTGALKLEEIEPVKAIHSWDLDFEIRKCKVCGDDHFHEFPKDYKKFLSFEES